MEHQISANDEFTGYNGVDAWFPHYLTLTFYSDGVKDLADKYESYWLIDKIVCTAFLQEFRSEEFQVWMLLRVFDKDNRTTKFILTMDDGNGNVKYSEEISFSDFKPDRVTLWFENNCLFFPSER